MPESYSEIVVAAPMLLVKGFVAGVLVGEGLDPREVLFGEELPLKHAGLGEMLAEWMRFHQHESRLLVPQPMHADLRRRLDQASTVIGLKVVSDRKVMSASCSFTFHVFARRQLEDFNALLAEMKDRLRVSEDYEPTVIEDAGAQGIELYSPAHAFEATGHGSVTGDLRSTLEFHRRASGFGWVQVGQCQLNHADD